MEENKSTLLSVGVVRESTDPEEFVEKMKQIVSYGCNDIIVGKASQDGDVLSDIKEYVRGEKRADQLVLYHLADFGLGLIKLYDFLQEIFDAEMKVYVIKDNKELTRDSSFMKDLEIIYTMQRKVLSDSSKLGQLKAEEHGFRPGRPTVSEDLVKQIRALRNEQKYSLREIANICGVSVGTVFKYAKNVD